MAINGLPPGLAKKAESGNLPAKNPHVKAYKAQQTSDAKSQEIADLTKATGGRHSRKHRSQRDHQ
jgi:hypothetical protein